jgi:predicted lipoprotein with Yx(FWY)xxD motif
MRRTRLTALAGVAAALGLALAGCDGTGLTAGSAPTTKLAAARSGSLGLVVTDAEGRTLYRFDEDDTEPPKSNCAGDCATQWPAALVFDRREVALEGVDQRLVGTVTRADGSIQLTLAGSPLYRFAGDTRPGETLGQGVGGTWFAVTPAGARAAQAEPTQQPSQAMYDGYGY